MKPSSTLKPSVQPSVCVFCGASSGNRSIWMEEAEAIGQHLAKQNWRLVYGAGGTGLMGAVARGALDAGGQVLGVIPSHLVDMESLLPGLTETKIVPNMFERKHIMLHESDAFLILPGGLGTLDEAFEVLTHKQLGQLNSKTDGAPKPIVFWDGHAFWTPFRDLIDAQVNTGFVAAHHRELFQFVTAFEDVIPALSNKPLNSSF